MCSIEAGEPSVQRRNAGKNGGAFGDNDKLGIENSVRYSCRTAGYKKSGSSCDGFAETFCDWKGTAAAIPGIGNAVNTITELVLTSAVLVRNSLGGVSLVLLATAGRDRFCIMDFFPCLIDFWQLWRSRFQIKGSSGH